MAYLDEAKLWHEQSNYLCQLTTEDERELERLAEKAEQKGIKVVRFYEPDLNNQLTAIALEPSKEAQRLTSSLPLMLPQPKEAMKAA